jgi:hypothetical protein
MAEPEPSPSDGAIDPHRTLVRGVVIANAGVRILAAVVFCLLPVVRVVHDLADPDLRQAAIPRSAWRLHRTLTPKFEQWAKARLASGRATQLSTQDISGTEWPLFGSVFYLWATESLQGSWETNRLQSAEAPRAYAKKAVDEAARLVIDPHQASWVKKHWGTNYLKTENVFYRMLVISALTSHARLTGDAEHLALLRDQVESLAAELDASPHGVLDDYPGECYPGDVLTAIAMIRRADAVLGTDHSEFVRRAVRGFQNRLLDRRGLVPYAAAALTGEPLGPSRGCGNSYVSLFAPEIWPEQARDWYERYTRFFWQEVWTAVGFREFPRDMNGYDWLFDVDAGPVLKGYGFAACAFGVGAARVNGHFEHAFPLTAEMFAVSCPLPDGTLLVPRLLSNATDAPLLGEAAILFNLTRLPETGFSVRTGGSIPGFTWIVLGLQATAGLVVAAGGLLTIRRWRRRTQSVVIRAARLQAVLWAASGLTGALLLITGCWGWGAAALLGAQLLPRFHRRRPTTTPSRS